MTQMLGKLAATAVYCLCCNDPRTHGQQRAKENREWRREQKQDGPLAPIPRARN